MKQMVSFKALFAIMLMLRRQVEKVQELQKQLNATYAYIYIYIFDENLQNGIVTKLHESTIIKAIV
jgi:hypothetical protein